VGGQLGVTALPGELAAALGIDEGQLVWSRLLGRLTP
jgi:hypothetical protein